MRIGLDIDDTISYTNRVLMKYAHIYNKEHGNRTLLKENTNNFSEVYGWNDDEVYKFFRTYYLTALEELEPKENVKEVLTKLRKEGHKIILITVRNDKECGGEGEAFRITSEWLKEYDIPYDELNLAVFDKKAFCEEHKIDVFMDDSEKNDRAVSELGIKTFMAINNFNKDFTDEKIENIYNMDEFYEKLEEYDKK